MGFKKKQKRSRDSKYHKFNDIIEENDSLIKYYQENKIVLPNDFNTLITVLKSDLPASFRLTPNDMEATIVWKRLEEEYLNKFNEVSLENNPAVYSKISWYTLGLAWQLLASRKNIRRSEDFANFHSILVAETEIGHISRQEAVSMIPVQLLDVKPHHKILDMCASPGSKTTQIIELLNQPQTPLKDSTTSGGIVIANDSDSKRCYLLVHQTKRMRNPNLLVLNQDASLFPNIRIIDLNAKLDNAQSENLTYRNIEYDRILCDVPCTGDGTLRKNPLIWSKWNIAQANSIHQLQLRILRRGLELLKVGGTLVYSTCSLNPVENEAVVSAILQETKDCVETVDCKERVPGLIYRPGMVEWKVMSKDGTFYENYTQVPPTLTSQIKTTCFPMSSQNEPERDRINGQLANCIRISPHYQDTGGFFVTVFHKVKSLPWSKESYNDKIHFVRNLPFNTGLIGDQPTLLDTTVKADDDNIETNKVGNRDNYAFKESPFLFFKSDETELWQKIRHFYQFSSIFPVQNVSYRSEDETVTKKNLHYVHPKIREIICLNRDRLKVISTGVRIITHNNSLKADFHYRLCQDGLGLCVPFMSRRKLIITLDDFSKLLLEENPKIETLSQELQTQVLDMELGSVCLLCEYPYQDPSTHEDKKLHMNLSAWLAKTSIRLFLNKLETLHYAYMIEVESKISTSVRDVKDTKAIESTEDLEIISEE